jgi:hypothetical protein
MRSVSLLVSAVSKEACVSDKRGLVMGAVALLAAAAASAAFLWCADVSKEA